MSSTGLLARTTDLSTAADIGHEQRATHDVITSTVPATSRADIGLLTSRGRVHRLHVVDLPAIPPTMGVPALSAGAPLGAFIDLPPGERPVCLTSLDDDGGIALGTASGVVKRVVSDPLQNKDVWDVIRLDDGDEVVGASRLTEAEAEDTDLVFVSSDGQLLRLPASSVRPQGRPAAGMAGIRLAAGARAVAFCTVPAHRECVVVTIAGADAALPGTEPGAVKVTSLAEYPRKGRATGGVRCHRFRRGEDRLIAAWAGPAPARAASASGVPVVLPEVDQRRDGTGVPGTAPIDGLGGAL